MYLTRYVIKNMWIEKNPIYKCFFVWLDSILSNPQITSQLLTMLDIVESSLQFISSYLITQISQANVLPTIRDVVIGSWDEIFAHYQNSLNNLFPKSFTEKCGFPLLKTFKIVPDYLNNQIRNPLETFLDVTNYNIEKKIQMLSQLQDSLKFVQDVRKYIQDP
ncbi:MAG: hypothetical protein QXY18_00965 [Nitrososphaerota archaeon]